MSARRWIHLFAMAVPVLILTAFNVLGIKPSIELLAAMSTMTATATAIAGAQVMQTREGRALPAPAPRKPRKKRGPDATRDQTREQPQQRSPARAAHAGDDDSAA